MKHLKNKKLKALTLTELLVVMIIIGILTLLALPKFLPQVTKARAQEAKIALGFIHSYQKNYRLEYLKYATSLSDIGFEQEDNAIYRLEIVNADKNAFLARATSTEDFDGDGNFNTWEINQNKELRETVPD